MKIKILKVSFIIVLFTSLLPSCSKDNNTTNSDSNCIESGLVKTKEVNQVPAGPTATTIVENDVIEAYIISSRKGNNFAEICLQSLDGSKGFVMPYILNDEKFETGSKVLIKLKGLITLQKSKAGQNHNMQIGSGQQPNDPESDLFFFGNIFDNAVKLSCAKITDDKLVRHLTIDQLKSSDNNLNTLVELDNVEFSNCSLDSNYYDPSNVNGTESSHCIVDASGNTINFVVHDKAYFANKPIPTGSGKIKGIFTSSIYGVYQFRIRTEEDIDFKNPRFTPAFFEKFDNGLGCYFTAYNAQGEQSWGVYAGQASMIGQNSNSVVVPNEDWLISSTQNFTGFTNVSFSFDSALSSGGFNSLKLIVLASDNYSGGNPSTATWTVLSPSLATGILPTASGIIDLRVFKGKSNVHIAFKYLSEQNVIPAEWKIDNIKIMTN
jgi:hypothetical protein